MSRLHVRTGYPLLAPAPVPARSSNELWQQRFARGYRQRFGWLTRARRIGLLLAILWVCHLFDLRFTLLETAKGFFVELNPIAAVFLGHSLEAAAIYKLSLLAGGSVILLALRRHVAAEVGAWVLLLAAVKLMLYWAHYFHIAPAEYITYFPPLIVR